jgi:menaquinone-dependent protoporphyrinogen oxidase
MRVMVAAASKHNGTWEIAEAIAGQLTSRGLEVDLFRLHPDEEGPHPSGYGAFVIGSGVYAGRWLIPARRFLSDQRFTLMTRPLWLFSSGPVGIVPRPAPDEAVDAGAFVGQSGALEHTLFGGRLERSRLGFAERALVAALGVPDGDNRDFAEIEQWTASIADTLASRAAPSAERATVQLLSPAREAITQVTTTSVKG